MRVINLGCGTKTSPDADVTNVDWSIYLRIRKSTLLRLLSRLIVSGHRRKQLAAMPPNVLVHNMAKGLPFADNSVDVVYHSHMLEHLDRSDVQKFFQQVLRVLKPGGLHRIVVPNFETMAREYLRHIDMCDQLPDQVPSHDATIHNIIEQSVRKESYGTSQQGRIRRFLENLLLGDARRRGETHQWLYDRHNLSHLLTSCGFRAPTVLTYSTSSCNKWAVYGLDTDATGQEYKPGSLYIEARK